MRPCPGHRLAIGGRGLPATVDLGVSILKHEAPYLVSLSDHTRVVVVSSLGVAVVGRPAVRRFTRTPMSAAPAGRWTRACVGASGQPFRSRAGSGRPETVWAVRDAGRGCPGSGRTGPWCVGSPVRLWCLAVRCSAVAVRCRWCARAAPPRLAVCARRVVMSSWSPGPLITSAIRWVHQLLLVGGWAATAPSADQPRYRLRRRSFGRRAGGCTRWAGRRRRHVVLAVVDGADHQLGVAEEGDAGVRGQGRRYSRTTGGAYRVLSWVVMVLSAVSVVLPGGGVLVTGSGPVTGSAR